MCIYLYAGHVGGCGITESVSRWMERIQNSAVEEEPPPVRHKKKSPDGTRRNQQIPDIEPKRTKGILKEDPPWINSFESPYEKYSKEANSRPKRAARPKEENRNTCSLFIQTDPLIWRHIADQVFFLS